MSCLRYCKILLPWLITEQNVAMGFLSASLVQVSEFILRVELLLQLLAETWHLLLHLRPLSPQLRRLQRYAGVLWP